MAASRREFVKLAITAASVATVALGGAQVPSQTAKGKSSDRPRFASDKFLVEMAENQPGFSFFCLDSLGTRKLVENLMLPLDHPVVDYRMSRDGATVFYEHPENPGSPVWSFDFKPEAFVIRSKWANGVAPEPLVLNFTINSHATLLGLLSEFGTVRLPALLHVPHHGSLRITASAPHITLGYDATHVGRGFVRITFPPANANNKEVEYRFDVTAIYPDVNRAAVGRDPRYDAYRRDFLSMLQINPRSRILANNIASDACAFTLFEYSMMAVKMPALADGLSALDILRQTLDQYVGGLQTAGMGGSLDYPDTKYDLRDTFPSLVLATADYVTASGNHVWIERNYSVIKSWADRIIGYDIDHDGLIEHPASGNSGSWTEEITVRPSNWWDTIGFGHKDAYANALAYKALSDMAQLSTFVGMDADATRYSSHAEMLKRAYYSTFYNPATGVLAGWKSADGHLHDYYFLFINGMAVTYGLVTREQGNQIWDKLMAKMKEVGYQRFDLGLPGNLIPVRREDYVDHDIRFGGGTKADGSDGFQIYENGGATACMTYFTIQALRELGRQKESDSILFPMLASFEAGGFQGHAPNGMTYDWTSWDGTPHGYEGLLVDVYLTLLAAVPSHS